MPKRNGLVIFFCFMPALIFGSGRNDFSGSWDLVPQKSAVIPFYQALTVEFQVSGNQVTIIQKWGTRARDRFEDSVRLVADGRKTAVALPHQVAPGSVFLGLANIPNAHRQMTATWGPGPGMLTVTESLPVRTSQGTAEINAVHTYALSAAEQLMIYTVQRATRRKEAVQAYTLKRSGTRQACFMRLADDWSMAGKLAEQVFLISLQGLANSDGPRLYFIYPEKWDFRYTPGVFDFLQKERCYTFQELRTLEQALTAFRDHVAGYVVWDRNVRTSLIVAFTVAGLEKAVVVSEELIPLAENAGLKPVADFRGRFTGQSDAQIYQWAKKKYWDRCSREYIVWLGGESGDIMKPGVADWGIHNKAFFNDLSARVTDAEEYQMADSLLADMNPFSFAFGWHSYKKDLEEQWVKLTSSHALRVEGLHSLPNMSFSSQVPATSGFVYKNNHHLAAGETYKPGNDVYIACIQTDGIGLGAWNQPGRGEIPYAWEVSMNYVWMAPMMLEYFYSQATANDYFIGCLGGPGYVYPKAVPKRHLARMVDLAYGLMKRLDLLVFEIMDYSQGVMVEGNSDLTREVVRAFYDGMPDAIGFVNGYTQSHTFTVRDKRPLISYDYYLAPECSEEHVAADLCELAGVNKNRPYFLLIHVRQYSNIKKVKSILDRLGPEFKVVPLDIFLKMAGEQPTFQERFLEKE